MPFSTLALLFLAAAGHTVVHVAFKRAGDKLAFVWWQLLTVAVFYAPILLLTRFDWPAAAWLVAGSSAVVEVVYYYAMSRAYTLGDLSVTYPLARGSAPLFTTLWASLFLAEYPSRLGLAGILTVAAGLFLVNLPALRDAARPLLALALPAARWALLGGLSISVYSILDKVGVRHIPPVIYIHLVLSGTWLGLTPLMLRRPAGKQVLAAEWRANKWPAVLTGIAIVVIYTLVLVAMQRSPVSYVTSVREVSVVVTAWVGSAFLGEGKTGLRVVASALVAAGILLIAIGG